MWYRKKSVYRTILVALIAACALITLTLGALSLVLPKKTVSEVEKRELAKKPAFSISALLDGSYMRDLELYYADTFPFRDGFVRLGSRIEDAFGIRYDDVKIVGAPTGGDDEDEDDDEGEDPVQTSSASNAAAVTTAPVDTAAPAATSADGSSAADPNAQDTTSASSSASQASSQASETTTTAPGENVQGEKTNGVFIYGNRAFELFGGSSKQKLKYADAVSAFAEKYPSVKVYNLLAPTSVAFYLPEKYASNSADENKNFEAIFEALSSKVTPVRVFDTLESHKAEYLYFNTDHHWTGLGAYYAYTMFAQAAGFTPYAYADYEKGKIEDFTGTLATSTNDSKLLANPDIVEYCYLPVKTHTLRWGKGDTEPTQAEVLAEYAKGSNAYSVYLGGDFPRTDIINEEATTDKVIVVFKESYGNAFCPYLAPHYAKVIVLDERYYKGSLSQLIKDEGVDEILIINNAFAANTKGTTTNLTTILGG